MIGLVWSDIASVFVCGTLVLYAIASLWWIFQVFILSHGWRAPDETEIGLDNVQVRILTIAAEATVQITANAVPDAIAETHVIAEEDIEVRGQRYMSFLTSSSVRPSGRAVQSNGLGKQSRVTQSTFSILMRTV
jgi:hypothetical protein